MNIKKVLYHPIVVALITVLAIYFIISLKSNEQKLDLSKQNLTQEKSSVSTLEQEVQDQKQKLEQSKLPLNQEKIIRNELLMQKPNELVIQLPEVQLRASTKTQAAPLTPWEKWQALLFE